MFNFLNVSDAKGLWPIVLLAAVGVAGWYVWNRSKQAQAANNVADSTSAVTSGNTTTLADLALLQSLLGSNSGSTTQLSTSQPTYTSSGAPSSITGSNAASAPVQQPITTSGSSTGNTYVTQGV
jgi:hypothetical protein